MRTTEYNTVSPTTAIVCPLNIKAGMISVHICHCIGRLIPPGPAHPGLGEKDNK